MYNCIYKNCNLGCRSITQHNARYSKIKTQDTPQVIKKETKSRKKIKSQRGENPKKSSRINYEVLKKLLGTI